MLRKCRSFGQYLDCPACDPLSRVRPGTTLRSAGTVPCVAQRAFPGFGVRPSSSILASLTTANAGMETVRVATKQVYAGCVQGSNLLGGGTKKDGTGKKTDFKGHGKTAMAVNSKGPRSGIHNPLTGWRECSVR